MPEVKEIVREMLARGMSDDEVLATLKDIGIENPETVLREARAGMPETPAAEAPSEEAGGGEEEFSGGEEPRLLDEREMPAPQAEEGVSLEAMDAKLDEALALLKALQDINKKILEANRDILLRMQK